MTHITSTTRTELSERRQKLRRQRRSKLLQASWRTVAISGLAVGSAWLTTLPAWVIREPEQITVEGNQLLSTTAIQSLLAIDYPQALLDLQPQAIAAQLESQAPIARATVTRHLLPPGLTVQVQERHPVAVALPSVASRDSSEANPLIETQMGLLDENGVWISLESYKALNESLELPELKVQGMREEYRNQWPELYRAVRQSPVKVLEIDWRQPSNLILRTELGVVHFGRYSSKFPRQLVALDQMRHVPQQLNGQKIAYINLQNPDAPTLQVGASQ